MQELQIRRLYEDSVMNASIIFPGLQAKKLV
jgi:hypothetical protein